MFWKALAISIGFIPAIIATTSLHREREHIVTANALMIIIIIALSIESWWILVPFVFLWWWTASQTVLFGEK